MAENKFEMKFRCPLEFVVEPEDVEKDSYEVPASDFAKHADEINKLIRESFEYDGTEKYGLAAYLNDDNLAEKIVSIIPSVENVDGALHSALNVVLREELTDSEKERLRKNLIEQLEDGWGWEFNEDSVTVGGEEVFIAFLCAKDGERLRVVDSAGAINQTMGGLS